MPDLDKSVINNWRDFAAIVEFSKGLEHLRRYHVPKVSSGKIEDMLHATLEAQGYLKALEDVETILTTYPNKPEKPDNDTLLPT